MATFFLYDAIFVLYIVNYYKLGNVKLLSGNLKIITYSR